MTVLSICYLTSFSLFLCLNGTPARSAMIPSAKLPQVTELKYLRCTLQSVGDINAELNKYGGGESKFEPNCAFCDTSMNFCTHLV